MSGSLAPPKPTVPLLGADGQPVQKPMAVPFIQWLPDGTSTGRAIERSAEIGAQAASFLKCGGRYSYILRDDGKAELVAGFPVKGGEKGELLVVAEQVVANGPEIGPAVDRLVATSIANLTATVTNHETIQ